MDIQQRNNVCIQGEGNELVMFAHGFGSNQQTWQYVLPPILAQCRVLLFDYVGAGNSDYSAYSTERYRTLNGYVQDVIDIIDNYELEQVTFVGHSISGVIGMLASLQRPQAFKKVIMIGSSACYLNDEGYRGGFNQEELDVLFQMMEMNFNGWASHLAPIVSSDKQSAKVVETAFKQNDAAIAREFAEVTFTADVRTHLQDVTVKTVLLQSKDDFIVPMEASQYLHEHLAGSKLVLLDVRGHYPHLSHPSLTIEHLLAHI
ncbi:MAG: alpha/beta hydrolase [Caryophanon sp.]|nr:alpha/beta hydrolase [Caryophanon sp.]